MAKKPAGGEPDMTDLNVQIPSELMVRIKLAKALTNQPIRLIAAEALDAWLRSKGVTPDKVPTINRPRPSR